jgi:hypothetical protein
MGTREPSCDEVYYKPSHQTIFQIGHHSSILTLEENKLYKKTLQNLSNSIK